MIRAEDGIEQRDRVIDQRVGRESVLIVSVRAAMAAKVKCQHWKTN
jgi:hypothetical protein